VSPDGLLPLVVSTLGGAAIGVERQWSGHADGEKARFAGVRTFTLLGLLGGLAGRMWAHDMRWLAALCLAAAAGLVVAAYVAASRRDVDATTEVAALVVLAAAALAGSGEMQLASGVIAVTLLLLVEKTRLHALVRLIDDRGFRAGVAFAVMALVVLPLLPEGPFGPLGGIRPRTLWALVLFFSGLSFAGYIARTIVGDRYGYAVAGLLGGLISSTNVTLTFARLSRERPSEGGWLGEGVLAACSVLFVRVAVAIAVLNAALLPRLLPLLIPPFVVGVLVSFAHLRRGQAAADYVRALDDNPLQLWSALQMAAAFQAVLFVFEIVHRRFGSPGIMISAMVLGLTDVDALTASIARRVSDGLPVDTGAVAIASGILANTLAKLTLAMLIGRGRFRLVTVAGLALLTIVGLAAIVIVGLR
jgi:uncharacterized membrane protein (DUF4010 family)